jgi:hypothetical protein
MGKPIASRALDSKLWLVVAAAIAGIGIFGAISAADLNYFVSGYLTLLAAQLGVWGMYRTYLLLKSRRANPNAIEPRRKQ